MGDDMTAECKWKNLLSLVPGTNSFIPGLSFGIDITRSSSVEMTRGRERRFAGKVGHYPCRRIGIRARVTEPACILTRRRFSNVYRLRNLCLSCMAITPPHACEVRPLL